MSAIDRVTSVLGDLPYMKEDRALEMQSFMRENDLHDVLEIGFLKGKSSSYFAAIMEDDGNGHLTTIDKNAARNFSPNINETLEKVGLSHRVTPIFARRSHTWEMAKMIRQTPRPQFDLCYFDGGHTWDVTGFGFVLVDLLLRPGGWIIFDDMSWTIQKTIDRNPAQAKAYGSYSSDEKRTPGVSLVFNTLVPERGYRNRFKRGNLGFAQKPI